MGFQEIRIVAKDPTPGGRRQKAPCFRKGGEEGTTVASSGNSRTPASSGRGGAPSDWPGQGTLPTGVKAVM